MTGTGLKKWSPPNLSLRWVELAISVMERDDVLLVKMVDLRGVMGVGACEAVRV